MNLKIITLILILVINAFSLLGQKIELFGGINYNVFHDNIKSDPHNSSSYKSMYGYSFGIGIDSLQADWNPLRITLQFDYYGGKIDSYYSGLGGGSTILANIKKSSLSLGLFPANFRFFKRIDLNFGFITSILVHETFSGTISGWNMSQPNWSHNIHDTYNRLSSKVYFGIQGKISYDFHISNLNSIIISPQYLYYYGFSGEFKDFETKSMRHYILIGIKKKI